MYEHTWNDVGNNKSVQNSHPSEFLNNCLAESDFAPWLGLIPVTTGVEPSDHWNEQSPVQFEGMPLIKTSTWKRIWKKPKNTQTRLPNSNPCRKCLSTHAQTHTLDCGTQKWRQKSKQTCCADWDLLYWNSTWYKKHHWRSGNADDPNQICPRLCESQPHLWFVFEDTEEISSCSSHQQSSLDSFLGWEIQVFTHNGWAIDLKIGTIWILVTVKCNIEWSKRNFGQSNSVHYSICSVKRLKRHGGSFVSGGNYIFKCIIFKIKYAPQWQMSKEAELSSKD